ncbi:hypothetical protein [Streptomyces sp. NRRL S-455]|uniref:hypothetical protein n=1 Tax=Streptomyces sp. NRRL S-455 TaxID=1463908 RepID=UPI0004C15BCE|nr:hypothetical protein [Streptomyces sp. NRRL S-455]
MAATSPLETSAAPVLPHRSRIALLLWFATQWLLIPLGFLCQVLMLLTGQSHVSEVLDPFRAFLSPYKLVLRLSRSRAWHERYLDREFARVARDIEQQRFSLRTRFHHELVPLPEPPAGPGRESESSTDTRTGVGLKPKGLGVRLKPRHYRGVPLDTLQRLAHAHHLEVGADTAQRLSFGISLFPRAGALRMTHTAADASQWGASGEHPVLPVLPRSALFLWFVVQWVVIPLEVVGRCLLLAFKLVADADGGNADGIDPRRAIARSTSPSSLAFQMSRDTAKRRTHLDRKVAALAEQLRTQRFSLATTVFHAPRWKVRNDSRGLTLRPRDYRGLPENTIEEIVSSHGLRVSGDGASLRIWEGQLWTELV